LAGRGSARYGAGALAAGRAARWPLR